MAAEATSRRVRRIWAASARPAPRRATSARRKTIARSAPWQLHVSVFRVNCIRAIVDVIYLYPKSIMIDLYDSLCMRISLGLYK